MEDVEGVVFYNPEMASIEDIDRVHLCAPSAQDLLSLSHFISAGGAIRAARARMDGEVERAFAIVRPPGHHAMQTVFGDRGFCVANIEAVMVEYIRRHYGVRKIAIVDTDCHHGDGTQDIFYNDPDTLFISMHQDGRSLYPGTGFPEEYGGPAAPGLTLNIPLPPGTSEEGFAMVMERVVAPALDDFGPELIINSAGQDNHYSDPLTDMNFTAQGYARLTKDLNADICVLEGGYSIEGALPYTNLGILLAMADMDTSCVAEPDYRPERFVQTKEMNNSIEKLCQQSLDIFTSRESLRKKSSGQDSVVQRRRIFYDTTGFEVGETKVYHLCPRCPGYTEVAAVGQGRHLHGFCVGFFSCLKCQQKAQDRYGKTKPSSDTKVILQDKKANLFTSK
ncbi:unnamed protein product [Cyprideis torosa]|uniref:Histone deacetylase domain-containing protein n=1 Tax=Cyprideis torosa TaxID=163714 RepID=A0A7R8WN13_9CRUS|nr:unnamed protein product [Cyprideis torosa]CAG0899073.1 unnamed protein product [Cyprideis torosa]